MRRSIEKFVGFAAVTTFLAGCGLIAIPLPDIDLTAWFAGGDGAIEGIAEEGVLSSGESEVQRLDADALGRGGLTLAGLTVESGTVDMNVPQPEGLVVAQPAAAPATVEVSVYLSATSFGGEYPSAARLVRATIDLSDNGDGTYAFSGAFDIGQTNQNVLDIATESDTFYAALVVRVLDADGIEIPGNCGITIEGLVAKPSYRL